MEKGGSLGMTSLSPLALQSGPRNDGGTAMCRRRDQRYLQVTPFNGECTHIQSAVATKSKMQARNPPEGVEEIRGLYMLRLTMLPVTFPNDSHFVREH
jgi:hypothetical protein